MGKGVHCRRGVLKIIHRRVTVGSRRVHFSERRIVIEHALLSFHTIIEDKHTINANPLVALHSAYCHLWICVNLIGNRFAFTRLYVQLVLKNMSRAERPHPRLVTVHCCKVICPPHPSKTYKLYSYRFLLVFQVHIFLIL